MALFTLLLSLLFLQISAAQNVPNENLKKSIQSTAFSAEFSQSVQLYPGETLVFDETITNVGGLYDSTTGEFACPTDGYSCSFGT